MAGDNENRGSDLHVELSRRVRPWGYDDPYAGRSRSLAGDYGSGDRHPGRSGESGEYDGDDQAHEYSERSR